MLAVTRQKIRAHNVIRRNQTLNLVENGHGVERAQFRFEPLHLKPHGMSVDFARLRSARLSHVGACASAEWNQLANLEAHAVGDAYDHFEIALSPRNLS